MNVLAFLAALGIFLFEGWLAAGLLMPPRMRLLRLSLALPLAALGNVLLVLTFTFASVPLSLLPLLAGHAVVIGTLVAVRRVLPAPPELTPSLELPRVHAQTSRHVRALMLVCALLLCGQLLYGFTHAVLLPTVQIDSLTNWTMRSKVSFEDRAIAFDRTEERGVAKPQYPFLFHALQVAANQGQPEWSDRVANVITFLLTVGQFASLVLLLTLLVGAAHALLIVTIILSIPLLSFHVGQGYADIHLAGYLLLSLAAWMAWRKTRRLGMLALSAATVSAAAWTKSEGIATGLLPWLLLCGLSIRKDPAISRRPVAVIGSAAAIISLLFSFFLFSRGLPLTPHEEDLALQWHPASLPLILYGFFTEGSLGVVWYALAGSTALLWVNRRALDRALLITLLWGAIVLAEILFLYTFTPNAQFLANGESFYRQLMVPAALLLLSCFVLLQPLFQSDGSLFLWRKNQR